MGVMHLQCRSVCCMILPPVVQVVAERWGSLSTLTAGLTEQRAAHGKTFNSCSSTPLP